MYTGSSTSAYALSSLLAEVHALGHIDCPVGGTSRLVSVQLAMLLRTVSAMVPPSAALAVRACRAQGLMWSWVAVQVLLKHGLVQTLQNRTSCVLTGTWLILDIHTADLRELIVSVGRCTLM